MKEKRITFRGGLELTLGGCPGGTLISNGYGCKKKMGVWVRAIKEQKMWGLWVTAETINKNMGSLGDSSAENRGSLEPYIRVTSIMDVPPG